MNSGIHLPNSQFGDIYSDYLLGVENGHRDLAKNKITENFDMNVISYNLFSYSKDEFPNIHSEESGFFERIYENIYIKHPRYINTTDSVLSWRLGGHWYPVIHLANFIKMILEGRVECVYCVSSRRGNSRVAPNSLLAIFGFIINHPSTGENSISHELG
jgi:hypothetical protein